MHTHIHTHAHTDCDCTEPAEYKRRGLENEFPLDLLKTFVVCILRVSPNEKLGRLFFVVGWFFLERKIRIFFSWKSGRHLSPPVNLGRSYSLKLCTVPSFQFPLSPKSLPPLGVEPRYNSAVRIYFSVDQAGCGDLQVQVVDPLDISGGRDSSCWEKQDFWVGFVHILLWTRSCAICAIHTLFMGLWNWTILNEEWEDAQTCVQTLFQQKLWL